MKRVSNKRLMLCALAMSFTIGGQTVYAGEVTSQQIQMAELRVRRDELKNELSDISLQMRVIEDMTGDTLIGKYRADATTIHSFLAAASMVGVIMLADQALWYSKKREAIFIGSLISTAVNGIGAMVYDQMALYPKYRAKFEEMLAKNQLDTHYQFLVEVSKSDLKQLIAIQEELKKNP